MGIIKAVKQAIGGGFADAWQEVIEPDNIGDQTVYARGVLVNRGQNKKGSDDIVSNGSIIHVYDNQFMILVDGGKIVDYTAEPGYYKVSNSSMPSLFNGQFGDSLKETFDRVRFGGQTPQHRRFIISTFRKSRESSLVREILSITMIHFIMQSCFSELTVHIQSKL